MCEFPWKYVFYWEFISITDVDFHLKVKSRRDHDGREVWCWKQLNRERILGTCGKSPNKEEKNVFKYFPWNVRVHA